jgi:hypothetical protein
MISGSPKIDLCHLIAGRRRLRFSFFLDELRPGVSVLRSVNRDEPSLSDSSF